MKGLMPNLKMPDGRLGAQIKTVEACENALAVLRTEIRSIEGQLQSGRPIAGAEGADWERRARGALKRRRATVDQIVCAVELAKEERRRQLIQMRLDRTAHAEKMERIRRANIEKEMMLAAFRDEVKSRVTPADYQDLWDAVNALGLRERTI